MTRSGDFNPAVIDLFSGGGGLSCGLEKAGFLILAGVDIEAFCLKTLAENFPNAQAVQRDLSVQSGEMLREELGLAAGELSVLAGGPPCQGFSKNVPRKNRFLEDPRNRLVGDFLRFVAAFRPRFVLLENVAEMRAGFEGAYTGLLVETLEARPLGYTVSHHTMNGPDYGLPQRRRRALFLASRDQEAICFPAPTHGGKMRDLTLFAEEDYVTVWDAISDLPALEHGEGTTPCDYAAAPQNRFQTWARNGSSKVHNHVARKLQPAQFERLASLQPGQGMKDLPAHLRPKSGYSGAYGRLTKEMLAPTITRWVFHPGSGRFGHPIQPRVITIREAARLQGFPDSFRFTGTYIQQSHQAGNAVPPLLAEQIGHALITAMRS